MALLHLMAEWRADGEAKPDLTVLTVDHGLRAESRDEAAMVTRVAMRLGLPHAILTWRQGSKAERGVAGARAGGSLRPHGRLLPCARYSGAGHRASPR